MLHRLLGIYWKAQIANKQLSPNAYDLKENKDIYIKVMNRKMQYIGHIDSLQKDYNWHCSKYTTPMHTQGNTAGHQKVDKVTCLPESRPLGQFVTFLFDQVLIHVDVQI